MRLLATAIFAISLFLIQPQGSAQNLRLQQVTQAGVVKNVRGNVIQFESDQGMVRAECLLPSGNRQQLALNEFGATRINVRGRESIQYLKKGMTIRFEADVVRGTRISNPIKQVTLITRHNFTQLGMEQQGNGVPDRRDEDAIDDDQAEDEEADNDARGNRNAAEKMVITGVVNFVDDEKFRVEIPDTRRGRGPRKITANWDEEPVVRIDAQEMAYIQPEDRITVVGYVIRGLNVMATSVEVEHVNADVAAPQQEADKLPEGQVFPRNDPLEKGFGANNAGGDNNAMAGDANAKDAGANGAGAKDSGAKDSGDGANAAGNTGRKPKKNRPPGRVFKIN